MSNRVLIVAGEASSSLYAQRLLEHWKKVGRKVDAFGVGSLAMEKLGFSRIGKSEELAVVGLVEVIKHFGAIKSTYEGLLAECDRSRPAFALLLDYPDFNLRLAADLKKRGIKVIYYISPQVWAWRKSRVHKIRRLVDEMLVVFPFEEDFYRKERVESVFVGHPLLDEVRGPARLTEAERQQLRQRLGFSANDLVLGLLPGSRHSELAHHLADQIQAAALMVKRNPKVKPLLICAPSLDREDFSQAIAEASLSIGIVKDDPIRAIDLCDFCLVASGTATLMVGLLGKPMVVMYRMNPITAFLAKRLVRSTPYFAMVNLILNERAVVELFQEQASPKQMADELEALLSNARWSETKEKLSKLATRLEKGSATEQVAARLDRFFQESGS